MNAYNSICDGCFTESILYVHQSLCKSPLVLAHNDEFSKTLLTLKCLVFRALIVQTRILLLHIAYAYHIIPLDVQPLTTTPSPVII